MLNALLRFAVMTFLMFYSCWSRSECHLQLAADTPDNRFVIVADEFAVDLQSGLMWKRCIQGMMWQNNTCVMDPSTTQNMTWQSALNLVHEEYAGFDGWRVPNKKELESIVERRCFSPAVNASVFPNTPSGVGGNMQWTSTPNVGRADVVWVIDFQRGGHSNQPKTATAKVRLVRDYQGGDVE